MADIEKTVSILFQGKDQLSKEVDKMEKQLNSFSDNAQRITQPLANIATSILAVNAAINTFVAGGIVLATKKAGEFGDSFNEISTLIDATSQDIDTFKGDILDYSRDSSKSIEDINAAVYTAISAGTDYQDSLDLTSKAERLAIASKADLEPTVKLLASTINAYGASTDEASKYSDVFFKTVKLGQTTLPEISQSLAQVSSIAASAGIPIETLSATIATLTANGAPTSQAITAIKAAISNIIKPSAQAKEEAERLNLAFDAQALKSKGLEGILRDVMNATGGNVTSMGKLFGSVEGLAGVLSLTGNNGEKFTGILEQMRNATGATDEAYGKMSDNFGLANQKLVNNINATIIKIGDKIIDKYGDVVGALTDAVKVIGEGVDSSTFEPIWAMLNEFGDDLVKGFNDIRDNLPEALQMVKIDPLIDSYKGLGKALKDAIEAVFGEIDLSTPKGMSDVVQKIVDAMTTLNNVTTGILKGLKPFLELIGEGINKFKDMDKGMADVVGQVLGFATGLNKILEHSAAITGFFAALSGATLINAGANITSIGVNIAALSTTLGVLGVGALTVGAGAGIIYLADKLSDKLAPVVNDTIDYFDNLAASILGYESATSKAAEEQLKFIDELSTVDDELYKIGKSAYDIDKKLNEAFSGASAEDLANSLDEWGITQPGWEKINGAWINIKYKAELDEASVEEVKNKVAEIPLEPEIEPVINEKILEEELEKIKTQAEIVATSIEWKAKLDIAEVEAAAQALTTTFDSINTSIDSTGNTLTDLWSTFSGGDLDIIGRADLQRSIEVEERRREESFNMQRDLTEQQMKLNDLKLEALERGDALITIDGAGLQPHLEAFMYEILEALKIRANAEGAEFLGIWNA